MDEETEESVSDYLEEAQGLAKKAEEEYHKSNERYYLQKNKYDVIK